MYCTTRLTNPFIDDSCKYSVRVYFCTHIGKSLSRMSISFCYEHPHPFSVALCLVVSIEQAFGYVVLRAQSCSLVLPVIFFDTKKSKKTSQIRCVCCAELISHDVVCITYRPSKFGNWFFIILIQINCCQLFLIELVVPCPMIQLWDMAKDLLSHLLNASSKGWVEFQEIFCASTRSGHSAGCGLSFRW